MAILSRIKGIYVGPEEDYHLAVWQKMGDLQTFGDSSRCDKRSYTDSY